MFFFKSDGSYLGRSASKFSPADLQSSGDTFVLIYVHEDPKHMSLFLQQVAERQRCIFIDANCNGTNDADNTKYFIKGTRLLMFQGRKLLIEDVLSLVNTMERKKEEEKLCVVNTCMVTITTKQKEKMASEQTLAGRLFNWVYKSWNSASQQQDSTANATKEKWTPPVNAVELELPCPLSLRNGRCPKEDYRWGCKHCGETLYCFKNGK